MYSVGRSCPLHQPSTQRQIPNSGFYRQRWRFRQKKKIWSDQPLNTNTDCANWLLITLPTRIICPSFGVNCHILNRFIRKSLCVRLSSKHHVNRFSTVACQRQHQHMKSCPLLQLRSHLLFVTMLQSRFSQKIHMAFLQHCLLCC